MKILILILLVSCGAQEAAKVKDCGAEPMGLSDAKVNDNINDPKFGSIFYQVAPSIYQTGSYISKNYLFNEYSETKNNWCYWYSITTNKYGKITDIYVGNK